MNYFSAGQELFNAFINDEKGGYIHQASLNEAAEIFRFSVPKRMLLVRRPGGKPDAEESHQGSKKVNCAVKGFREYGYAGYANANY